MTNTSQDQSALRYGLGAVALWSTVATAFKIALTHLTPLQLLTLASLTSWLFLSIAVASSKSDRSRLALGFKRAIPAGLANPLAYYLILFAAYDRLPGQEAMALNYTWALTMSLLSVPLLGHRLSGGDLGGAVLAYLGVWTIATRGHVFSAHFADAGGVGLALLSTMVWAVYWLANARDPRPALVAQWQNFTVALPLLAGLCWWHRESLRPLSGVALGSAAYVGLFEMGVSFLLWQEATRRTSNTARVANLIFLSPPVSLMLLHFVKGEEWRASTLAALVLILGGLALQNLTRRAPSGGE